MRIRAFSCSSGKLGLDDPLNKPVTRINFIINDSAADAVLATPGGAGHNNTTGSEGYYA
jgi:hypothetical protein